MSDDIDVPVTVGRDTAQAIADDLANGESFMLRVHPDDMGNLEEQIRWQLGNDEPVTELVDEYTGEKNE